MCCNRTGIDEEGSLLVRRGGLVLHEGQTGSACSGIEIIHGDLIVSAAEVGVWIHNAEVCAITPSEVCVDWILSILVSERLLLGPQTISVRLGSIALRESTRQKSRSRQGQRE